MQIRGRQFGFLSDKIYLQCETENFLEHQVINYEVIICREDGFRDDKLGDLD